MRTPPGHLYPPILSVPPSTQAVPPSPKEYQVSTHPVHYSVVPPQLAYDVAGGDIPQEDLAVAATGRKPGAAQRRQRQQRQHGAAAAVARSSGGSTTGTAALQLPQNADGCNRQADSLAVVRHYCHVPHVVPMPCIRLNRHPPVRVPQPDRAVLWGAASAGQAAACLGSEVVPEFSIV